MSHNETSDPENLKTQSTSSNRKAYLVVAIISLVLIVSGVIYWAKISSKTESTKSGSNNNTPSSNKVQSIDRIFFIKSNYRKISSAPSDEELPPVTSELYSVLSDGTNLKHYSKAAEVDKVVVAAHADAKNKLLIVNTLDPVTKEFKIVVQDWDSDEILKPDSTVIDGFHGNLFPDGSKIIFIKRSTVKVDNEFFWIWNLCTFDLKEKKKEILKSFASSFVFEPQISPDGKFVIYGSIDEKTKLYKMDLNDKDKVEEINEMTFSAKGDFKFSPEGDKWAEIHEYRDKYSLKIYDLKTKSHETIYQSSAEFFISSWSSDGKFIYLVEELNTDLNDSQVLIKIVDVESDDLPVIILKNEEGKNIGCD